MNRPLRIGAISYPILFQTIGGLQIQVWETVDAVRRAGHHMSLIDPTRDRFTDFDLIHVFSIINGNHTIIQQAHDLDVPVVLSPLVRPIWTRQMATRAKWADSLMGRLTGWSVSTEFRQISRGLRLASHCVALGPVERDSLYGAFEIPLDRIDIVPNGIPARFFDATSEQALAHFQLEPGFVLCVASIDPHKNQLGLARALQRSGRRLVLVGQCMPAHQAYLDEVLRIPGTCHLGSLAYDDPLLPSLYAGAGVFCLASHSEVMPLVVLEALAAGTPAVMTRHHCMDVSGMGEVLREVEPSDDPAIAAAIDELALAAPQPDRCRAAVGHLSWDAVATDLVRIYERVVASRVANGTTEDPVTRPHPDGGARCAAS